MKPNQRSLNRIYPSNLCLLERLQPRLPLRFRTVGAQCQRAGAVALTLGTLVCAETASAAVYHVAQTAGSDANPGSESQPFASISACARVALAGDVCRVHSGIYRETVSPANSGSPGSPIRFEVADGECATVSGTQPITASFTRDQGNVWVAPLSDGVEQLFSNGTIAWEGQWPNRTAGVMFDEPKAVAAQGSGVQTINGASVTVLIDPQIPAGDWTGALVYIMPGSRWQSDSRPIRAYDATTHTITLDTTVPWAETSTQPIASNHYYLYGSALTLDVQDEWFWNSGNLRYYSVDDPGQRGLEYKKRYYAFDVTQSYVEIVGFHVFGAAVRLTGNHNTVDSLSVEYSSHLRAFDAYNTVGDVNRVAGDDNVWKNSVIAKSGSAGLIIAGSRNLVSNNVITDVVYQATNHAGIDMGDWSQNFSGNQFVYNTVARSGRSGIFLYGSRNGRALFNKVSEYALLTNDMGGIYAWGTDGQGTEIAYNDVGNTQAFWSNGIYLDDKTKHFVVHHNYVHDSKFFGSTIKEENYYLDNTFANVGAPFLIDKDFQKGQWTNTKLAKVQNNLTDGAFLVRVGVLPTVVTDYGYFEADVHVAPEWTHVSVPFASLYQPGWFIQAPFDLSSVAQIAFVPFANGDFQFDLDNIRLEGPTPLMLDDFESGGTNTLGGAPWAGGSGDGTASTGVSMTLGNGGPAASSVRYAAVTGTMFQGYDAKENISWGQMVENLPGSNLSSYTGLSFDIRGQLKAFRVLAIQGNSPEQSHNATCAFAGTTVPSCALEQGAVIDGVTGNYSGSGPDIGAFESGVPPFTAGAVRSADPTVCGRAADVSGELPTRAVNPWSPDSNTPDAGVGGQSTGGTSAIGTDAGAGGLVVSDSTAGTGGLLVIDSNPGTGVEKTAGGGGCSCRIAGTRALSRTAGAAVLLMALVTLLGVRRASARKRRW